MNNLNFDYSEADRFTALFNKVLEDHIEGNDLCDRDSSYYYFAYCIQFAIEQLEEEYLEYIDSVELREVLCNSQYLTEEGGEFNDLKELVEIYIKTV